MQIELNTNGRRLEETATRMQPLRQLLLDSERWLMQRTLFYAKRHNYVKYTSTLLEAWRISIESLTATMVSAIDSGAADLEFCPDEDYRQDPIAAFGVEEGIKHRSRGLTLAMYLSLLKYYRQAYLDLLAGSSFRASDAATYHYFIDRCFDRIELGVASSWASTDEQPRLKELQVTNRYLANEKNKYLTIFESLHDPVILLDKDGQVHNMNHIAAALFANASHPGDLYYGDTITSRSPGWLEHLLVQFTQNGRDRLEIEQTVQTHRGLRHYLIKLEQMLDVSEKYMGVVVLLNDLTARREAEQRLQARSEEISTLYDVTAIVTTPAPVETVLERALERVLSTVKGQGGSFRLLNTESKELELVAGRHEPGAGQPAPACEVLAALVVAHDAPLVIDDMLNDGRVPAAATSCHAFAAVPHARRWSHSGCAERISGTGTKLYTSGGVPAGDGGRRRRIGRREQPPCTPKGSARRARASGARAARLGDPVALQPHPLWRVGGRSAGTRRDGPGAREVGAH